MHQMPFPRGCPADFQPPGNEIAADGDYFRPRQLFSKRHVPAGAYAFTFTMTFLTPSGVMPGAWPSCGKKMANIPGWILR